MSKRFTRLPRALWDDSRFRRVSDACRLAYLIIRSGPTSLGMGIQRLSIPQLAEDLGWGAEAAGRALDDLASAGLIRYDRTARVVYLPGVVTDFPPENPAVLRHLFRMGDELPASRLVDAWRSELASVARPAWTPVVPLGVVAKVPDELVATLASHVQDASKPEPEPVKPAAAAPKEPPGLPAAAISESARLEHDARRALVEWNAETGQALRSDASVRLARARLAEGYAVADLVLVARWAKLGPRAAWLGGDNDRHTNYRRPETLWAPSKFASYLQAAQDWKASEALSSGQPPSGETVSMDEDERRTRAMNDQLARRQVAHTPAREQPTEALPDFDEA